jgi:hypothetical protein
MNLVQINERLKDLPTQVLQQYANGMNPEVPPYLALGELQRREMSQKQAATAQGAQQGPQPSVKEQVEQKAGLMALQQMQQQQLAQQMQQPRGPMPAPAGVPQPEPQPQAMMARGGLAGIPVRRDMFEYAGGGIIAFQAGGQPKYETRYDKMNRENREQASKDEPRVINVPPGTPDQEVEMIRLQNPDAIVRTGEEGGKIQALLDKLKSAATYSSDVEAMKQRERVATSPSGSVSEAQASAMAGPKAQMPAGLPAALTKAGPSAMDRPAPPMSGPAAPTPGAPRPAPAAAPAGIAAALPQAQQGVSPYFAKAAAAAEEKPVAPTPESIIAEQNKLLPASMRPDAMKKMIADQRARAEGRQAAYEKSKPSGLDDLIRVFGQAGQYKGLSGLAPAYTANEQQRRAEDLAMQKQQDELLTAIEGRQYGADKELFGAREKSMTAANKSFQDRLMTNTKALADLAGVDQRRIDEAAQRLTQVEIEKMRSATQNRSLNEKLKFEADFLSLKAQARDLEAKGDAPGAAKLEARANDMLSIRSGGSAAAGVGAERNDISRKRLQIQTWEKIRDSSSDQAAIQEAEKNILQLARDIAKIEGGTGGNAFTVTAGGKTYTFPTQEAANKFKAEAGVK